MNNNQQPMKRCLLHIQVDAATRASNAQRSGDWKQIGAETIEPFFKLAPTGKLVRYSREQGTITFRLPRTIQYGHSMSDEWLAWLDSLTEKGLEYSTEEIELQAFAKIKINPRDPEQVESLEAFTREHGGAVTIWSTDTLLVRTIGIQGDDYIILHNMLMANQILYLEMYLAE